MLNNEALKVTHGINNVGSFIIKYTVGQLSSLTTREPQRLTTQTLYRQKLQSMGYIFDTVLHVKLYIIAINLQRHCIGFFLNVSQYSC